MAKKIMSADGKVVSGASVLSSYFGRGGKSISEFMVEVKQLSPESKEELVIGAAKELGYVVTE